MPFNNGRGDIAGLILLAQAPQRGQLNGQRGEPTGFIFQHPSGQLPRLRIGAQMVMCPGQIDQGDRMVKGA